MMARHVSGVLVAALIAAVSAPAFGGAVRAGFGTVVLQPNDDGSTGLVNIGFPVDFYGITFGQLYINNNGNATFDASLSTYTPFNLTSTGRQIIAPFFADVDTRNAGNPVTYGQGTVDGRPAFGVNWRNVDCYYSNPSRTVRNDFQLVLIERSDTGPGNFDFELNFDRVQWEAGQASGGNANCQGGSSARVGFSNGTGAPGTSFELPGSAINGAFLDNGPPLTALIHNSLNSTVPGRYLFSARNGVIIPECTDGDGDGLCDDVDCDDGDPTIGQVLHADGFNANTGFFTPTAQLSDDPWVYGSGMVAATGSGQQALIGGAQTWTNVAVYATFTANGTLGGCCGEEGPINRWRAGVLIRASRDADQDEGYHGYRCALGSNAETVGGVPHSGPSTGHFLQIAEFMDGPEDDIASECEGGDNTTFNELGRTDHAILDLAAGDTATLMFRVVGDQFYCEVSSGGATVFAEGQDDSFTSGTVGMSTLNMLAAFDEIKVCEVIAPIAGNSASLPQQIGLHGPGAAPQSGSEPGDSAPHDKPIPPGAPVHLQDPPIGGCSAGDHGSGGAAALLMLLGLVSLCRRRREN